MYEYAPELQPVQPRIGLAYLQSCTMTVPTRERADLITEIAARMRMALDSSDAASLQKFVGAARVRFSEMDDLIGAAEHVVVDDLMRTSVPIQRLQPIFSQLSAIERSLYAPAHGIQRVPAQAAHG